MPLSWDFTAR